MWATRNPGKRTRSAYASIFRFPVERLGSAIVLARVRNDEDSEDGGGTGKVGGESPEEPAA